MLKGSGEFQPDALMDAELLAERFQFSWVQILQHKTLTYIG